MKSTSQQMNYKRWWWDQDFKYWHWSIVSARKVLLCWNVMLLFTQLYRTGTWCTCWCVVREIPAERAKKKEVRESLFSNDKWALRRRCCRDRHQHPRHHTAIMVSTVAPRKRSATMFPRCRHSQQKSVSLNTLGSRPTPRRQNEGNKSVQEEVSS